MGLGNWLQSDAASWVEALSTVGAAVFAWRAFRSQSRQLDEARRQFAAQDKVNAAQTRVLALQVQDLEASLAQRRREQANAVTVSAIRVQDGTLVEVSIWNTSNQAIFDVHPVWYEGSRQIEGGIPRPRRGDDDQDPWAVDAKIEPQNVAGSDAIRSWSLTDSTADYAEVVFRDAAGLWWRADDLGHLRQSDPPPSLRTPGAGWNLPRGAG